MKNNIPNEVAIGFFTENIEGAVKSASTHRGRCPACGDSQQSSAKKRLYLLSNVERGWTVYCHNCELSMSLYNFVKEYYPTQYSSFRNRCLSKAFRKKKKGTTDNSSREDKILSKLKNKPKKQPVERTEIEKFYQDDCVALPDNLKQDMKERRIPYSVLKTLRFCVTEKRRYKKYKNRIVIPFFDKDKRIYYFQARAIDKKNSPKYINWERETDESKPEYNEFGVDMSELVYIVEGLFDSTFIDNAVSTLGVKMSHSKFLYFTDKYKKGVYCMDNDPDGIFWTTKLLKKNMTCLIFPPEYKEFKDLNDIAIHEGVDNLTDFVKNNSHKGIKGLLHLQKLIRS